MTPTHHPSDAFLIAYAAGTTGEAESLAVATHLAFCPDCRTKTMTAESVGGALLDGIQASPMQTGALQSALSKLDENEPLVAIARTGNAMDVPQGLPRALCEYVADALASSDWRMVAPGIRQLLLSTSGAAKARLMKLKPGTVLPEHGHRGTELTLLLAGSYTDELGHFAPGDMAELDDAVTHRPVVDEGAECLALIVTETPLRFRGWLARLAQPLIGI